MSDDFTNRDDTASDDAQRLLEVFTSPTVSEFLRGTLDSFFPRFFQGTAAGVPYGSNALFSQQDVGRNLIDHFNQQSVNDAMQKSEDVVNKARFAQAMAFQRMFSDESVSDDRVTEKANNPFSPLNLMSNFVFAQTQPLQLQAGLEHSMKLMGAGSGIGLSDAAMARDIDQRTAALGAMSKTITADVMGMVRNDKGELVPGGAAAGIGFYGGLRGGDIGRVMAEMSRRGGLNQFLTTNGATSTEADIEARAAELRQTARKASQAVASFRQIFRGSVTDVLDQVNSLIGADIMQTLGPQAAQEMGLRMGAAGGAAGFRPAQMAALGGMSMQFSRAMGLDHFGSMSNATESAFLIRAAATPGLGISNPMAFVNEPRFRQTVVQRVTGAEQSQLARSISGAFALLRRSGLSEEDATARVSNLGGGILTPQGIASQLGIDVNAQDIISAGFLTEAEQFRAKGGATRAALGSNLEVVQGARRAQLDLMFRGFGDINGQDVIRRADRMGGGLTLRNIETAMNQMGVDGVTSGRALGMAGQLFERNARSLGFQNRFALDALLTAQEAEDRMDQLRARTDLQVDAQLTFGDKGVSRGFLGLRQLAGLAGKTNIKTDVMLRGAFRAFAGNTDISAQELTKFITGSEDLFTSIRGMDTDAQARAGAGVQTILEALQTNTLNGESLTSEQVTEMREALMSGDPNRVAEFGDANSEAFRNNLVEIEANRLMGNVTAKGELDQKKFKSIDSIDKKTRNRARDIVAFNRAMLEGGDSDFTRKLDTLVEARRKGTDLDVAINQMFDEGDALGVHDFTNKVKGIQKDFSSAQAGLGAEGIGEELMDILNKILRALLEGKP
jgi:hypothetical protein